MPSPTILLAGLDFPSVTGLLCAGLSGLAVFLAVRRPAIQLRRMTRHPSRFAVLTAPLARVIRGRTEAPPLVRRALLSTGCAVGLCLAGARLNGLLQGWIWLGVPVVAAAGVLVLGWLEPQSVRRRRQQLIMEAPQALELMAACLGAGLPARSACAAVVKCFDGPVADDLGQVLSLLELGVADVDAWRVLDDHPQLGLAAADLARSAESGTSMVEGLQHHAAAAREARRGALLVRARAVGVRTISF
ncbi:MAG: type II secretion system F family protein [Propionibacteriaceae bacterium]